MNSNSYSNVPIVINTAQSNNTFVSENAIPFYNSSVAESKSFEKENTVPNYIVKAKQKIHLKQKPWYARLLSDYTNTGRNIQNVRTLIEQIENALRHKNYELSKQLFDTMLKKSARDFYSIHMFEFLQNVILTNNLEIIQYFFEKVHYHYIDLTTIRNGGELLEIACRLPNSEEILSYLLRIGINTVSLNNCPLITACAMGNVFNVQLLLSYDINIALCHQEQPNGETIYPLQAAVLNGNVNVVRLLLQQDAPYTNMKDIHYKYSLYPLQLALLNHKFEIADLIVSEGYVIEINEPFTIQIDGKDYQMNLFEYASYKQTKNPSDLKNTQLLQWLISHGASSRKKTASTVGGRTYRHKTNRSYRKRQTIKKNK